MTNGDLTINLAAAVIEARAHLNEMHATHGPDSILTQRAHVQLRVAQNSARDFMSAND